jgi:hypothetical protein
MQLPHSPVHNVMLSTLISSILIAHSFSNFVIQPRFGKDILWHVEETVALLDYTDYCLFLFSDAWFKPDRLHPKGK